MRFENTTNRSWWIISDPTYTRGHRSAIKSHQPQLVDYFRPNLHERAQVGHQIPPTAVGGLFQTQPTREGTGRPSNPTNRSWWIISDPTYTRGHRSAIKSHQPQW